MGPIMTTIDAAIHDVKAPAATVEQGPGKQHVLGSRVDFSQSSSDDTIAHIATATPPPGFAAGDVYAGPGYPNLVELGQLISSGAIEKFQKPADTGGQTWLYIEAGEAIARGEAVMLDATEGGKFIVLKSDEAGKTVGVAQWNIPAGSFAWVLCAGVGKVLVGAGGVTQGERLAIDGGAAGTATDVALPVDVGYGRALETAAAAALADAVIACIA